MECHYVFYVVQIHERAKNKQRRNDMKRNQKQIADEGRYTNTKIKGGEQNE